MRTQEQIIADCEARFQELREEKKRRDADPMIQRSCETCRFRAFKWPAIREGWLCTEPLVVGFSDQEVGCFDPPEYDWAEHLPKARLCGPEKALWEPKPTIFQRIYHFIFGEQ